MGNIYRIETHDDIEFAVDVYKNDEWIDMFNSFIDAARAVTEMLDAEQETDK